MLNKIKDMKVEKKLKTCFTFTVIIASIAAVLGLIILLYTNITYNHALINSGFSQGEIGIFSTYLSREPIIVRELILLEDEAEMKESEDELSDTKALTDKAYEDLKPHCQTKAELEYISEIDKLLPAYRALFDEVKVLAMNNQNEEAFDLLIQEAKPTYKELTDAVEALIDLNVSNGNTISRRLTIQTYLMTTVMIIIIIVSVVIAMRISKLVARIFADPIVNIQKATAELEHGNLDVYVEKLYPDEIGEMTDSFNTAISLLKQYVSELSRVLGEMADGNFNVSADVDFRGEFLQLNDAIETITTSLSTTLGNIHESSNQVSLGASQMAESAQALAEGATDQAASVQELTATIQDVTEAVIHSSEKAIQSNKDAEAFRQDAEESSENIQLLNQANGTY